MNYTFIRATLKAALLAVTLIFSASPAANYQSLNHRFEIQASPINQHLTQQIVSQTIQDNYGNIWFVTQEGLNKYNGHEVENFRHSLTDNRSLSHNSISRVDIDSAGDLWVATMGGGLNRYNHVTRKFTNYSKLDEDGLSVLHDEITTIFADSKGNLWIGYADALSKLNTRTHEIYHYQDKAESSRRIGKISGFAESQGGDIYIATSEAGILVINANEIENGALKPRSFLAEINATHIAISTTNQLWAGTANEGVFVYDLTDKPPPNLQNKNEYLKFIKTDQIFNIYEDRSGSIWLCTLSGIHVIGEKEPLELQLNSSNTIMPADRVYSAYQSKDGKYWIGNILGLHTATRSIFEKHDSRISRLSNDSINAFAETGDGILWVATDDGLNFKNKSSPTFKWINELTEPAIPSSTIMSLLGEGNILWAGTFSDGLIRLDTRNGKVSTYTSSPDDHQSLPANGVTSIARLSDGKLAVGTYGGGLALLEEKSHSFQTLQHDPENKSTISNNNVIAIHQDSYGKIWAGTEKGLNIIDLEKNTTRRIYTERHNTSGLTSDMVWAIHEDNKRNIWLGTKSGGLNFLSHENNARGIYRFENFSDNIAIPSSNVYGIKNDSNGNIWISHNKGLTKFSPRSGTVRHYGTPDGLQAKEFNMGASYQSESGEMYFGGNQGFNIVRPWELKNKDLKPDVHISDIKIMNQRAHSDIPYDQLTDLHLNYKDRVLSIEFFASDYTNPSLNQYAYMLEGIDDSWVISSDARNVSFTTLPPGSYTLKLAAANPSGAWNWDGRQLRIHVSPPPWQSSWAYAGYILTLSIIMLSVWIRQKKAVLVAIERQQDLERRVKERTVDLDKARRQAESANIAKSRFLATVSHEIRTPMHGLLGMTDLLLRTNLTNQQKNYIETVKNNGESLLNIINDILDFSKIESGKIEPDISEFDILDLLESCCYLHAQSASRKNISLFHCISANVPRTVLCDQVRIRQIINNLLGNAVKFTDHGTVSLTAEAAIIDEDNNTFSIRISVEDTGIGIKKEALDRVFSPFTQADSSTTRKYGGTGLGLSISRELTSLLGGTIEISSEENIGTKISIQLPLQSDRRKSQNIKTRSRPNVYIFTRCNKIIEMITPQIQRLGVPYILFSDPSDLYAKVKESPSGSVVLITTLDDISPREQSCFDSLEVGKRIGLVSTGKSSHLQDNPSWSILSMPTTYLSLEEAIYNRRVEVYEAPTRSPALRLDAAGRSPCILVAEDMETNKAIIREMLGTLGCNVDIVSNGSEAFDAWKSGNYDLVLMDCHMPVLDGYSAARLIRADENLANTENEENIPIIAVTAGTSVEEHESCIASGMNDVLSKPFILKEIYSKLRQHLPHDPGNARVTEAALLKPTISATNTREKACSNLEGADDTPVLDIAVIQGIKELEKNTGNILLTKIVKVFKEQSQQKIAELQNHTDPASIKSNSHALKSMALNVGAKRISMIASEIERNHKDITDLAIFQYNQQLATELELYENEIFYFTQQILSSDESMSKTDPDC